jgi:hypothetical protein
VKGIGNNMIPF